VLVIDWRNHVDQILGLHELKIINSQPIQIEMGDFIESSIGERYVVRDLFRKSGGFGL
jgi:hypothetical protein